jgi:molybdate transport system ATP-binding protein
MSFELRFRHAFPGQTLDMDLTGGPGITALFGPSGAGKTTATAVMAGLLRPDTGRVRLGDRVLLDTDARVFVPPYRRRIGCVFQDGRLFPHLDVAGNLRFGRRRAAGPPPLPEDTLVDLLGLGPLLTRRPGTLSGGERQRVALGRALLAAPEMLVMDEPLAALDGPRKDDILPYLDRLKSQAGLPILYVTHDVDELARLADSVALLQGGRVVRQGPVFDVLADPAALPLVGVRDAGAVLVARVVETAADGLTRLDTPAGPLELPGVQAAPGDEVRLRIPAHDVILAVDRPHGLSARNVLPAEVEALHEGRGPGVAVGLRCGEARLLARMTHRSCAELGLRPGLGVFAILKATAISRAGIST